MYRSQVFFLTKSENIFRLLCNQCKNWVTWTNLCRTDTEDSLSCVRDKVRRNRKNSVGWRYNKWETANTILQSAQWCHTIWMWLDFIIKQNLKNKPILSVLYNAFKTNRPDIELCPSMSCFLLKNCNSVPFGTLLPLLFLQRDEIRRLRFVCFCNVPIIEEELRGTLLTHSLWAYNVVKP